MAAPAKLSRRVLETENPVMVLIQKLLQGSTDAISLAQGVVYWQPPEAALDKIKRMVLDPCLSRYGADEGLPELREALLKKLSRENKLSKSSVMVTAGANQAFVNLVLTLCDAGDSVVVFAPYYFNAFMAFQMTGVTDIIVGPGDPLTLYPDVDWLEKILTRKPAPKLVTVVNPGNPSGIFIPEPVLQVASLSLSSSLSLILLISFFALLAQRISEICRKAGSWLVVDNTYECAPDSLSLSLSIYLSFSLYLSLSISLSLSLSLSHEGIRRRYFMYDGLKHYCLEDNHIVNVFSFSKIFGMMGWRVGYIAYPSEVEGMGAQLLKVQDCIPICASLIGQHLALYSMEAGEEWIRERVKTLERNREILKEALSPLGNGAVKGGEGAIYLWAKLPEKFSDDFEVVRWLLRRHGVVVIPGSSSGSPGYVRISFGGLKEPDCLLAAQRLRRGVEELLGAGMVQG